MSRVTWRFGGQKKGAVLVQITGSRADLLAQPFSEFCCKKKLFLNCKLIAATMGALSLHREVCFSFTLPFLLMAGTPFPWIWQS